MSNFKQASIASLKVVRELTQKYGGGLKKKFGQNFLINQNILFQFINSLNISKHDTLIEIGSGIGVISFNICQLAKKVILIEIDEDKVKVLRKVLSNFNNYEIILGDATKINYEKLFASEENLKIIGSLPFNVSKKIVHKILNSRFKWNKSSFMMQKEVVDEYLAEPPKATFLSNFVNLYAQVSKLRDVDKINFYPIPKVNASILVMNQNSQVDYEFNTKLIYLIKKGFSMPRKNILNNLKDIGISQELLDKSGIKKESRPSELTLDDWKNIFKLIFVNEVN